MSLKALTWALEQDIFSCQRKFVLVALANFANENHLAYPSVQTVCSITSQNDKTVRKALKDLISENYIEDTGDRAGSRQQVKVYKLNLGRPPQATQKRVPLNGEGTQKRVGQGTQQGTQIWVAEPGTVTGTKSNNGADAPGELFQSDEVAGRKKFVPPTLPQLMNYATTLKPSLPVSECHECFDHYVSNGWKVGKNKMVDWEAAVRNWKRRYFEEHGRTGL